MMGPGVDMEFQGPNYIDPQMNNQPLSFNSNKGKPPIPIEGGADGRKRDDGSMAAFTARLLQIPSSEQSDGDDITVTMGDDMVGGGGHPNMAGGNMTGIMMQGGGQGFFGNPMGGMGPMMPGPMMGPGPGPGPDMMGMANMGNMMMFGGMPWDGPMQMTPPKEIIRMKCCVLYPPPPNAPPATTRERPPGCRTIFVGGLPENCTEEQLQEVFSEFGATTSIRKSKKKNFAHVRFEDEGSVDRALFLSGYRMKLEDKDDKQNTGRLHVDFAMARDDQYEFECKQRSLMRDMRHRQRMEQERLRPPSPPPVVQYSDYEASQLTDSLKSDDEFMKGAQVLCTWLDRGDVNRRNINQFYTMIQCTNAHIRRLLNEKQFHNEELEKMKQKYKTIFEGILKQFDQIEKIFTMAQKQRNWDHFTKAQRKNIELWLKHAKEIKQSQEDEFLSNRQEDEMEMSDDEDGAPAGKKKKTEYSESMNNQYAELAGKLNQINILRDENDALKCQIEAYKNELEVTKQEKSSSDDRDKEVRGLQMAMQGMQQQLIQTRNELLECKKKAEEEKNNLLRQKQAEKVDRPVTEEKEGVEETEEKAEKEANEKSQSEEASSVTQERPPSVTPVITTTTTTTASTCKDGLTITEKEAQLVGLVCCFLHVHPTGASVDYIWSYLHRLCIVCRVSELESLMEKMPMIFRQEVTGVGATIERRWHFTGYKNLYLS